MDSASSVRRRGRPPKFPACGGEDTRERLIRAGLAMLTETFEVYDKATPLNGPGWFECFNAASIGKDLETGAAVAFLSEHDIHPGVDRVVAIYPDGRAFAWQQLNDEAEK